jgi:carbon monoxide dehydrogenase subunit G
MIANANVKKIIAAPSNQVWQAIRSVGRLDRWFPVIESCHVEGEGVGAIRILGLAGGGEMRDKIVEIDDTKYRLRYERFQSTGAGIEEAISFSHITVADRLRDSRRWRFGQARLLTGGR